MMFPFTLPSMRNVPVTVKVPSRVTPWSMKPVHSSLLAPFAAAPGHFHAMATPKETSPTLTTPADKSTRRCKAVVESGDGWKASAPNAGRQASLLHQAIIQTHQLGVFVVLQHELSGPHLRFFS